MRETIKNINLYNFLSVSGIPQTMNKHILVLEYADDGALDAYLKEHFNELNWNDKLSLALQLADAVAYLHDREIIHYNLVIYNLIL